MHGCIYCNVMCEEVAPTGIFTQVLLLALQNADALSTKLSQRREFKS